MSKATLFMIDPNNGKSVDYFETSLPTSDQKLNALKQYLTEHYSIFEIEDCKIWISEAKVELSFELSISEITHESVNI